MPRRVHVEFIKRTKVPHVCQHCRAGIAARRPAVVLIEESIDEDGEYWKSLSYFCHLAHYRATKGGE